MKFFSTFLPLVIAGSGLMARPAGAQPAPTVPAIDPTFQPGFAALKKATGIVEVQPDRSQTSWTTNCELLVGVKAVKGSERTIYFVELTTLPPPLTNSAGGPWRPLLETNVFDYWLTKGSKRTFYLVELTTSPPPSANSVDEPRSPLLETNAFDYSVTNSPSVHKTAQCILSLYPVRLRVFDESGRQLKEGRTLMPWGLGTNGLQDMCRMTLDAVQRDKDSAAAKNGRPMSQADKEEWARSTGSGFVWMFTLFGQLQTVPELKDVWAGAHCAFRLPRLWTMAAALVKGLKISLGPRMEEVTAANPGQETATAQWYRFPVDLKSGGRQLTSAELVVGPSGGAEMLLAGIRSVRAVHPTRLQREFFAQVLASGRSRED